MCVISSIHTIHEGPGERKNVLSCTNMPIQRCAETTSSKTEVCAQLYKYDNIKNVLTNSVPVLALNMCGESRLC